MNLGIIKHPNDTAGFLGDLLTEWQPHYAIEKFAPRFTKSPLMQERLNRRLLRRDFTQFVERQDVLFFEWASEYLAQVSHMPKTRPIVARLHRFEMFKWVDRINWHNVDRLILVSSAMQQKFIARFPEHAHITTVIFEAVSMATFTRFEKPFAEDIGILCHLTPRKRVYELVLSFCELKKFRPNAHLHIGGGEHVAHGDYYDALHSLVAKLGLQDSVTFYGHVTNAQQWYRNIDVFVANAYSEGLQVSPMEAMASGTYCLAHAWDGAEELLPQSHIYCTSEQLQQRLTHYFELDDAARRAAHSQLHQHATKNFDVLKTAPQFRTIFDEFGRV